MTDEVVIFCTCANEAEASHIAKTLVEERLAACVSLLQAVRSTYRWQGEVQESTEILVIIKTTKNRFPELRSRLMELHSYDMPEIIALPITGGSDKYLAWIRDQVS